MIENETAMTSTKINPKIIPIPIPTFFNLPV